MATRSQLSPYTGWIRDDWTALADRLLLGVRARVSPQGAHYHLPGAVGGYGRAVDGLEGYARSFLLAGFRITGENGRDELGLAERYARGLAAGTDPRGRERWVRPSQHAQAKVEAASIALVLDLTRAWIWDRLDPGVQERVVGYLADVVGDHGYPRNNWVWFRIVVEQFLRSVGGPWSIDDLESDLAFHDSLVRADGWYSDGDERSFDHYNGWALHLYPVLWSRMRGAEPLARPRRAADEARLDRYLQDALRLIGADGSPLIQGRSLTYRFAAAAPFWAGALAGTTSVPPGLLRRAASGIVRHFGDHGVPDAAGLLPLGWFHPWPRLAQRYSGPGSPYWASKGLLGLALPADHPVWTATEEPLPVEVADQLVAVRAPGWVISSTRVDGVVRVLNHGTDHARAGRFDGDSPLYARLGYSTVTAPGLTEESWTSPLDQSVVLLDATGRATHRTGFTRLLPVVAGEVAVLASRARCHWLEPDPGAPDHGAGRPGRAIDVAGVVTVSVVRGAWEVRLVRVDPDVAPAWTDVIALRVGGWPLSGDQPVSVACERGSATAQQGALVSVVSGRSGLTAAGVSTLADATPLGKTTAVPWVSASPVPVGRWLVMALALGSGPFPIPVEASIDDGETCRLRVVWPDGHPSALPLRFSP